MKVEILRPVVQVTLEISGDEARLLRQMIQNPIRTDESPEEQKLRETLWNALSAVDNANSTFGSL